MRALVCLVVALAAAGCSRQQLSARTRAETRLLVPVVSPAAPPVTNAKPVASMLSDADGSQRGTVRRLENGYLVLAPAGRSEAKVRLRLLPTAPILHGKTAISADQLRPGADVRVYLKSAVGPEVPEALGVELLDPGTGAR